MDPRLPSQFEIWITIYTVEIVVATAPALFGSYFFFKTPAEKRSSPSFILGLAQLLCAIGYNVVLICGDIIRIMQIPVGIHRVFTLTIPGCLLFYFTLTLGESALLHSLYQLYRRKKTRIAVNFIAFLVLFQAISLALVMAFVIAGDVDVKGPQRYYAGLKGWGITAGLFTVLTNLCLSISFVSFYKAKLHYAFINRKFVNVLGRISLQHALLPTFFVLPTSYLFIRQRATNRSMPDSNLILAIVHQFYLLSFSISVAYAMYQLNLGPRHYHLGHLSKQVKYSAGEIVQAFRHEKKEEAIVERYVREAYLRIGCVSGFIFDWVDENFVPSSSFQLDATLEEVNVEFQSANAESIWDNVLKTAMLKNETVVESSEQIEESSFTLSDGNAINVSRTIICVPVVSAFGRSFICIHSNRDAFVDAICPMDVYILELLSQQLVVSLENFRLFKDLASMNRELDLKVADRTEELEKQKMELQAAKVKAESSDRAKSVFLANMSHEVRTPASQIISAAEMLSDSRLTLEQMDYLNIITSSGKLLLNLLNDILDISKLDSQKLKLECAPFNVRRLIKDTVEAFAVSQSLHVAYFVDIDIPHVVIGDALRLQQIFTNLISNALKFTTSGYVFLQARMNSFTENVDGGLCEMTFSVSDSGSGISKEKMDTIFQRFEQENTSISRLHGGTGLGLAISQDLCGLMNSKLHATSELGRGSTFYFTVRLQCPNKLNTADPTNLAESHTESVLLATNPGTVLRDSSKSVIQLQLENYGLYNISSKLFSAETLDDLFEFTQSYDYVILDVTSSPLEVLLSRTPMLLQPRRPFIVICTHDQYGDLREIEDLSSYMKLLRYPYKQSMLYQTIQQLGKSAINVPPTLTLTPITMSEEHDIKILLAEDNPVNQKVMKAMFKKLGHTIDIASNGIEAVTMAEENDYDIIFMDVRMPVMSGLEATAKIRAQFQNRPDRNKSPPVIVGLSADALQENREEGMRVGMDEYLSKPVSKDTMAKILKKYGG